MSDGARIHRALGFSDSPGEVTREEQDDGSVRYGNLLMLAPGEWTDAASEETLFYSPEMTERLAENPEERVDDNTVNVDHQHRDQLLQVGNFDTESLETDSEGNLYADVVLWNDTQASQDAVALMDRALETDGEAGAGGLSVEIPMEGEELEWDSERGMNKMVAANLGGLAIVKDAASEPASFDEQLAERSVAMSAEGEVDVRCMSAGSSVRVRVKRARVMAMAKRELVDCANMIDRVDDKIARAAQYESTEARDIVNDLLELRGKIEEKQGEILELHPEPGPIERRLAETPAPPDPPMEPSSYVAGGGNMPDDDEESDNGELAAQSSPIRRSENGWLSR